MGGANVLKCEMGGHFSLHTLSHSQNYFVAQVGSSQQSREGQTMSAHFDGGAEIAGRRLREVEVSFVDDPTLDLGAEDSDDCPASPPPTYYLRVREGKRSAGGVAAGGRSSSSIITTTTTSNSGSDSCQRQVSVRSLSRVETERSV